MLAGDHTVGDLVHSLDHVESLVVTLPIKVIDGQIYYHHNGDKINQPFQARRKEPIVTESEDSSDVDSVTQVVKSRTDRFSLNLDIPTEVESVTETLADCETSQSALVNEDVIVAEHGAEVPVVTTPLHCEIDIQQCVADIIGVMEKEIHNQRPPLVTKEMSSMSSTLHTLPDSGPLQSGDDVMSGAMVEESVLLDSSDLHDDLVMGNEVVLSLEGSSQSYDLVDYNELLSSLLLHSCLPKNGGPVSLS